MAFHPLLQNKSELWSFLSVLSCIVGLICSAKSLSSKQIFKEQSYFSILLHIIIGLFIVGFFLFTEKYKARRSFWMKSLVVFSVLMFTASYSFFYDEYVKEQPDAYGILSNSAFAFMSLCFSRKLEIGFEAGFLQFFLQNLTIQLMEINWTLTLVAAVYCCFLISFCYYLDSQQDNKAPGIEDGLPLYRSPNGQTQPSPSIGEFSHGSISRDSQQNGENYKPESYTLLDQKVLESPTPYWIPKPSRGCGHKNCSSQSLLEYLPREVRTPTVLMKYVRVRRMDDGDEEGAYQATVKVAGLVFKGFLYGQCVEDGDSYPNLTELPLGHGSAGGPEETGASGSGEVRRDGASSSSPTLDPSDVFAAFSDDDTSENNVAIVDNGWKQTASDSQHLQLRRRTRRQTEKDGESGNVGCGGGTYSSPMLDHSDVSTAPSDSQQRLGRRRRAKANLKKFEEDLKGGLETAFFVVPKFKRKVICR